MLDKRFLLIAAPLALAACGKSGQPEGQVVATVGGQEITTTDLEAELNGAAAQTPEQQKMLQRAALDNIINRKIVAQAAAAEGLDKGPKAAVLMEKAKEMALIELYNQKMRTGIPAPSDEEVRSYIDSNPAQFAQHRVFVVDQLVVPRATAELAKALEPVKTLEQAQQVLAARKVPSNQTVGVIDALTIPPEAAKQIAALPADEVFIIPANGGMRINHVRSSQVTPITDQQALQIGREILGRTRIEGQMRNELGKKIEQGRATVKYNAAFAPPKAPAGASTAGPQGSAQAGQ